MDGTMDVHAGFVRFVCTRVDRRCLETREGGWVGRSMIRLLMPFDAARVGLWGVPM